MTSTLLHPCLGSWCNQMLDRTRDKKGERVMGCEEEYRDGQNTKAQHKHSNNKGDSKSKRNVTKSQKEGYDTQISQRGKGKRSIKFPNVVAGLLVWYWGWEAGNRKEAMNQCFYFQHGAHMEGWKTRNRICCNTESEKTGRHIGANHKKTHIIHSLQVTHDDHCLSLSLSWICR